MNNLVFREPDFSVASAERQNMHLAALERVAVPAISGGRWPDDVRLSDLERGQASPFCVTGSRDEDSLQPTFSSKRLIIDVDKSCSLSHDGTGIG